MLVCLLRQLLSRRLHLFKHAQCLCTWIMQKGLVHLEVLWLLFETLLSHIGDEPVLIALRAILDCSSQDGHTVIIDKFLGLKERIPNLRMKVIVTSETKDWALRYSEFFHDVPMKNIDSVGAVLKGIVGHRVKRLVGSRPAWRELDGVITDKFWNKDKDFYLAMAKIQELETESHTILSTKAAIMKRLDDFPTEMEYFFSRMVRKIPKGSLEWLLEAIRWICFALRPVTSGELAVAVAFNELNLNGTETTSQVFEKTILSDLPGDMNRIAGYWVNVNGGRVELINTALRSFLVDQYMPISSMHAKMLTKCLKYLSWVRRTFATENDGNEVKIPYFEHDFADRPACRLLEYAALYWPYHFDVAKELDIEDVDMVQAFLEDSHNLKFWSGIVRHYRSVSPSSDFSTSPLKAAAAFGLTLLVERFLEKSTPLGDGTVGDVALLKETMDLAIEQGHTEVALKLCAKLQDLNSSPGLHKAAENGHVDLLQEFLAISSVNESINDLDVLGYSPLHYAAQYGQKDAVSLLLRSGAQANIVTNDGLNSTALHLASKIGRLEVARILVDHGADHRVCDSEGYNPLQLACAGGFLDLVIFLLPLYDVEETGGDILERTDATEKADITEAPDRTEKTDAQVGDMSIEKDHLGETPVLIAAVEGHSAIVDELLNAFKLKHGQLIPGNENLEKMVWGHTFPLHKAVSKSQEGLGRILIHHGYDVNSVNSNKDAPIHIAARNKAGDMIKFLVQAGADLSAKGSGGKTALSIAVGQDDIKMVSAILEAADLDKIIGFIDIQAGDGDTPLYDACRHRNKQIIQLLLDKGADPKRKCSAGWTPLHEAAMRNNVEIMELLFNAGADHDIKNAYQSTAIVLAAEGGGADAIRLLVKKGALANVINKTGSSALHRAAQNGHVECVKLLVEAGGDLNVQKINGTTPLHLAVLNKHHDVVKYLLERGVDVNLDSKVIGTPLKVALDYFNSDVATLLVEANATTTISPNHMSGLTEKAFLFAIQHPAAVTLKSPGEILQLVISRNYKEAAPILLESVTGINETGGTYHTALQAAAVKGNIDIMEKLFEKGADPNIYGGLYGSALHAAIAKNNKETVALLLKNSANPNIEHKGSPLVHHAVAQGSVEIVKLMLDHGADSNVRDVNGRPLLSHAIQFSNTAVIDHLLTRSDISIHDTDLSLRTPLMTAVMLDKSHAIQKLLEKEADPNVRDSEDKSPLIRAVAASTLNLDTIRALLEHHADPSLRDCRGRGALHWACLQGGGTGYTEIIEMLLPRLRKGGEIFLRGELALHAAASLTADTTPAKKQSTLNALLRSGVEFDLAERDDDGWTASYTATCFGFVAAEEAMILYSFGRHSARPKKPTGWHLKDKAPCLEVSEDGKSVTVRDAEEP
ncbi:ankyrin repeat-containing domain protein [Xylaria intraflava]|nr:ankyrin repeat-containing domain protein [Xylaria intraflava]